VIDSLEDGSFFRADRSFAKVTNPTQVEPKGKDKWRCCHDIRYPNSLTLPLFHRAASSMSHVHPTLPFFIEYHRAFEDSIVLIKFDVIQVDMNFTCPHASQKLLWFFYLPALTGTPAMTTLPLLDTGSLIMHTLPYPYSIPSSLTMHILPYPYSISYDFRLR
jgi:hypothetical protein